MALLNANVERDDLVFFNILPVLNYSFRIGLKIDFFQQGIFEIAPGAIWMI